MFGIIIWLVLIFIITVCVNPWILLYILIIAPIAFFLGCNCDRWKYK